MANPISTEFWEGDATKQNWVKKVPFPWMGSRHSVNGGIGKEFYRKGNSLKRFQPFSESPDSRNWNFLCSSPSQISAPRIANKWASLKYVKVQSNLNGDTFSVEAPKNLLRLQSPRPATEPRNPETPKCISKSQKFHCRPLGKMGPKVN